MSGFTIYQGVPCECANCGARVADNKAHMHVMWSNQYGAGIRVFCDQCGEWSDRSFTDKRGHEWHLVPHAIPHPTYVDKVFRELP